MIASSARMAAPLTRQALRQTASRQAAAAPRLHQRRMASTTAKAAEAAKETVKSDAPWAIGSLVVFGGLFVYLTSPPKGGKKGHGHDDHGKHDEARTNDTSDSGGEPEDGDTDANEREFIVDKKIEDHPDPDGDAPAGSHHLAKNSLSAEDGAQKQKTTKSASDLHKPDDKMFKAGIKSAKEGHSGGENSHHSDPKAIAAGVHEERAKDKKDKEDKADNDKKTKDDKDTKDKDEKEVKELNESFNSEDANAQNNASEEDRAASEEVHASPNAEAANKINEEEGSLEED
jgi:hypothetical protein